MTRPCPFPSLAAALFMAVSSPLAVRADERAAAPAREGSEVVAALRANGAHLLALGTTGGLSGYLVTSADGGVYALYLTSDGHAVAGLLYGPDGGLLTGDQITGAREAAALTATDFAPNARNGTSGDLGARDRPASPPAASAAGLPPSGPCGAAAETRAGAPTRLAHALRDAAEGPDAAALFARSASAFGFTLGDSGPLAVLFADPACRWSRAAAARLGREAVAGRFRLRVVPVGLLGAASARAAAAVASANDPARAWFERAAPEIRPEGRSRIVRNNALHEAWGESAVPLIVWRTARGRVARRVGDVDDVEAWLEEVAHE